jgi:hypothetical protein
MFLSAVVGGGVAATSALLAVRKAALKRTAKKSEDELEAWERLGLGEKCRPLFLVDFHSGYTHLNHGCVSAVTAWRALAACLRVCPSSCLPCDLPCVVRLVGTATPAGVVVSSVACHGSRGDAAVVVAGALPPHTAHLCVCLVASVRSFSPRVFLGAAAWRLSHVSACVGLCRAATGRTAPCRAACSTSSWRSSALLSDFPTVRGGGAWLLRCACGVGANVWLPHHHGGAEHGEWVVLRCRRRCRRRCRLAALPVTPATALCTMPV